MGGRHDLNAAGAFQGPQRGPEPDTRPYANHCCVANERTDDSADHHSADNGASHEHCASAAADDHCADDNCASAAADDHCASDHIGSHGHGCTA